MLNVDNLAFAYPGGPLVLDGLCFELPPGAFMGLCGANGSGKSTLIDLLAGLISPVRGEIRLSKEKGQAYLRKRAAFLPQNVDHFILGATAREELSLGLKEGTYNEGKVLALVEYWNLGLFLDEPLENLSSGQKKRLALASALAMDPELMLLDEPFGGLDWPGSEALLKDLQRLKKIGCLVILATHEPSLIRDISDFWLLLGAKGPFFAKGEGAFIHFREYGVRPL